MKKQTFTNATIDVVLQHTESISTSSCATGVMSKDKYGHFLFEEGVRRSRSESRNPLLYDGPYLSLTRKKDGRYSFNMKPVSSNAILDFKKYSDGVRKDLKQAFEHIQA